MTNDVSIAVIGLQLNYFPYFLTVSRCHSVIIQ